VNASDDERLLVVTSDRWRSLVIASGDRQLQK
jgi:hypothetical protein